MDDDAFNPDHYLALIALYGLVKGWCEVTEKDRSQGAFLAMRIYGMVFMAGFVIDMKYAGLAWASALHFVLKYLGTYHGARLLAWAGTASLARFGLIRAARDHGSINSGSSNKSSSDPQ